MGTTLFIVCGFVIVLALSFKPEQASQGDNPSLREIAQSIRDIINEENNQK